MLLENVLNGIWAKSTIKKKIKESSEELKVDYTVDQTKERITNSIVFLVDKSRGKAKGMLLKLMEELGGENDNPSWSAPATPVVDKNANIKASNVVEENKQTDKDILESILKKMNLL